MRKNHSIDKASYFVRYLMMQKSNLHPFLVWALGFGVFGFGVYNRLEKGANLTPAFDDIRHLNLFVLSNFKLSSLVQRGDNLSSDGWNSPLR